jgi:hypothetical protein
VRANSLGQHQYESGISHVPPIAPSNEFVRSVSRERAVSVGAKIRFVKAGKAKLLTIAEKTTMLHHDMLGIGFFAIPLLF